MLSSYGGRATFRDRWLLAAKLVNELAEAADERQLSRLIARYGRVGLPFSGWTKTFTDPRLCAAIVDRLTFAGQIIETGTTSYRLPTPARQRAAS